MDCAVSDCKNHSTRQKANIKFYKFPTDPELWQRWSDFCGPKFDLSPEKPAYVCSEHFLPGDFERNLKYEMGFTKKKNAALLPTAVPTVNIYYSQPIAKKFKVVIADPLESNEQTTVKQEIQFDPFCEDFVEVKDEPEIPLVDAIEDSMKTLKREIIKLRLENIKLKKHARKQSAECNRLDKSLKKSEFQRMNLEKNLRRMFTQGQIIKMKLGGESRVTWDEEVITKSTELYAISKKAYAFMLQNNFPFPSIRTVQSWITNAKIAEAKAAEDPTDDLPVIISYIIETPDETEM